MNDTAHVQIDETRFVHQTVDGEVLVIDFQGGTYYCIRGSVAPIWPLVAAGAPREAIDAAAIAYFAGPADPIRAALAKFIDDLRREGIVCLTPGAPAAAPAMPASLAEKPAFVPLTIERYDDMRDLLTLDPVHDVTDGGWPNLPR